MDIWQQHDLWEQHKIGSWERSRSERWKLWWAIVEIEKERGISENRMYPPEPQQKIIDAMAKEYRSKPGHPCNIK